jgi:hypothetical protein
MENQPTEKEMIKKYLLDILGKAAGDDATPEVVEIAPRVAEILLDII